MYDLLNYICESTSLVDITLNQYGMQRCEKLHHYGPVLRKNYIFHYIYAGSGVLELNRTGMTYPLRAGQGFMVFPDEICSYHASQDDPWHYAWFECNGLQVPDCMTRAGLSVTQPIFELNVPLEESVVARELLFLCDNTNASVFVKVSHAYLLLQALIDENIYQTPVQIVDLRQYYIDMAIAYIAKNYINPVLTVESIAAHCNINRSYLGRLFREYTSMSTQAFLIRYRMAVACSMLQTPKVPIKTIAYSVGYENQLHFTRVFTKVFGKSPTQWRNSPVQEQIIIELPALRG